VNLSNWESLQMSSKTITILFGNISKKLMGITRLQKWMLKPGDLPRDRHLRPQLSPTVDSTVPTRSRIYLPLQHHLDEVILLLLHPQLVKHPHHEHYLLVKNQQSLLLQHLFGVQFLPLFLVLPYPIILLCHQRSL
jgi:hypothetical protein